MKEQSLKNKTAKSFGYEWDKFNDVFKEYEDNFLGYIFPIDKDFFKGKSVLDAGCGAGRHAYFAGKYGANVVAFDLSENAVNSAKENVKDLPNVKVLQADMYNLSEEFKGKFDYVFCLGVLQHLPDPKAGFNKLVECLKPNGLIGIWVYSRKDNKLAMYVYEPIRKITTLIPHSVLYYLVFPVAGIMQMFNWLKLPIFSYYAKFPFKTKWNDAFDVFSAPSAKYYTLREIDDWYKEANLKYISVAYRELDGKVKGIRALGKKD